MTTARDIMRVRVLSFGPDLPIHHAIDLLVRHRVSGGPVVERDVLVGVLSERDCLNLLVQGAAHQLPCEQRVRDYMRTDVVAVRPDDDLLTIGGLFLRHPFRRVPVIDGSRRVLGQISRHDVLLSIQRLRTTLPRYPDYRVPA